MSHVQFADTQKGTEEKKKRNKTDMSFDFTADPDHEQAGMSWEDEKAFEKKLDAFIKECRRKGMKDHEIARLVWQKLEDKSI